MINMSYCLPDADNIFMQVCNNSAQEEDEEEDTEENSLKGALGLRADISTLCLDSQVALLSFCIFVFWNASQIVLIIVHWHPQISPLAMIEHNTPISFPKRHIPNLNPDNPPEPHIPTKHSRLNWLRTRMTVTHFITATNCPLRSRVVEISCSTTSEW